MRLDAAPYAPVRRCIIPAVNVSPAVVLHIVFDP